MRREYCEIQEMFLSVSLSLILICSSRVLGSPGVAWTEQETLTVKAKLYAILGEYGQVSGEKFYCSSSISLTNSRWSMSIWSFTLSLV